MSSRIFWATLVGFNCFLAGINIVNDHLGLVAINLLAAGSSLISVKVND